MVVWADRPDCPDLACAATSFPAKPDGSGRTYDELFVRHWDTWATPGRALAALRLPAAGRPARPAAASGSPASWSATRRPSRSAAARRSTSRATGAPSISRFARPGGSRRHRPTSTFSPRPPTARRRPANLTAANDGTDTLPTVSPDGRTLAYVAMARADLRGRPPGGDAPRHRQRAGAAADAGLGRLGRQPRLDQGRPRADRRRRRSARASAVPGRRRHRARRRA